METTKGGGPVLPPRGRPWPPVAPSAASSPVAAGEAGEQEVRPRPARPPPTTRSEPPGGAQRSQHHPGRVAGLRRRQSEPEQSGEDAGGPAVARDGERQEEAWRRAPTRSSMVATRDHVVVSGVHSLRCPGPSRGERPGVSRRVMTASQMDFLLSPY